VATAAPAVQLSREEKGRRAIRGAFLGFFVDMFDIYLPIVVLAPAIAYFVSPELSASETSLITGIIFAATLVGRPIGAFIFGHYADRIGRKRATIVSVSGFGALTVVIGCLPGYEQWGMGAVVLFVLLRFVVGIFVGGEYTAASPLAMEYSPKEKRAINSARVMIGFPLAYVAISVLTLVMLEIAPAGDVNSPYVQWGWRIPFFIGGAIAAAFVWYFARSVDESELFEASGGTETPLKELFKPGPSLRNFGQVFLLMTGFWLSLNTVTAIGPGVLQDTIGLSGTETSITLIFAFAATACTYMVVAVISQKIGRRPFLMAWGIVAAVVGTFFYWLLLSNKPESLLPVVVLMSLTAVFVFSNWGITTAYINERFHTGVRASGFGLGYSLAVILPAFYAFYQGVLGNFMDAAYTPLPLLVLGGLLITIGAAAGPETRDVDLDVGPDARPEEAAPAPASRRFARTPADSPATTAAAVREESTH
jgi:MFS family permease